MKDGDKGRPYQRGIFHQGAEMGIVERAATSAVLKMGDSAHACQFTSMSFGFILSMTGECQLIIEPHSKDAYSYRQIECFPIQLEWMG